MSATNSLSKSPISRSMLTQCTPNSNTHVQFAATRSRVLQTSYTISTRRMRQSSVCIATSATLGCAATLFGIKRRPAASTTHTSPTKRERQPSTHCLSSPKTMPSMPYLRCRMVHAGNHIYRCGNTFRVYDYSSWCSRYSNTRSQTSLRAFKPTIKSKCPYSSKQPDSRPRHSYVHIAT
jgi:hypothetical protein